MNWYRAKTILIILFICVNIFLGTIIIIDRHARNAELENTLSKILTANNIELDIAKIPVIKSNISVPEFLNISSTDKLIAALMSSPVKSGDNTYTDGTKKMVILNNTISYTDSAPNQPLKNINMNNAVSKLRPVLKKLNVDKLVFPTNMSESNGVYQVDFGYTINKHTLFNNSLSFSVSKNGIHKIEGSINIPNTQNGYSYDLVNIETILLNFIKNNKSDTTIKLSAIKFGYYFRPYEEAISTQAIPVYQISAGGTTYLYDARMGIDPSAMQIHLK